jgi:hypothetical protein
MTGIEPVPKTVVSSIMVTYIGRNESGCHFHGAMVGTVVDTASAEI